MDISALDVVALACLLLCCAGYTLIADHSRWGRTGIATAVRDIRRRWMEQAVLRENRIADTGLLGNLMRSIAFFASTTIFIVGGLLAILGAGDQARAILREIPLIAETSKALWEVKVVLLIGAFTYSFFKFSWALRQFTYCCLLLGAAPQTSNAADGISYGRRAAKLANLGGDNFNAALRAYYFGLAGLSWFIHPALLIVASLWVVLILYRREFRSPTLEALRQPI